MCLCSVCMLQIYILQNICIIWNLTQPIIAKILFSYVPWIIFNELMNYNFIIMWHRFQIYQTSEILRLFLTIRWFSSILSCPLRTTFMERHELNFFQQKIIPKGVKQNINNKNNSDGMNHMHTYIHKYINTYIHTHIHN